MQALIPLVYSMPVHIPVWLLTPPIPGRPALDGSLSTDVCVIGAGIAGLSVAYHLAREGCSVVVLDDGPIGRGTTASTTAHLASAIDDRFYNLERIRGIETARLAASSHAAAIDRIEQIIASERIDAGFQRLDGYLFRGPEQPLEVLEQELHAAHRAGLVDVALLPRSALVGFDTGPCLRFPRQAQFHPLRYLAGLADAIERMNGRIFTGNHVQSFEGRPALVKTDRDASVTAGAVVVATNVPINNLFALHTKQAAYMTYVIAGRIPRESVERALYWDTLDPYHYVRLAEDIDGEELLVVGGEDHKTGQEKHPDEHFSRLESWARLHFPMLREVVTSWSGQVMETIDGLAFIGLNPLDADNVYVATGDSGMGMTHGTIAGMLISDLILGRSNAWTELYDPARKPLRAGGEFVREAANMAAQYADWVTPGDVDDVGKIALDSGAIIRRGFHKIAVYRDSGGRVHERSAICPHLGCIVQWNSSERTWDCPCHGSRFDATGRVTSGPANSDLVDAAVSKDS